MQVGLRQLGAHLLFWLPPRRLEHESRRAIVLTLRPLLPATNKIALEELYPLPPGPLRAPYGLGTGRKEKLAYNLASLRHRAHNDFGGRIRRLKREKPRPSNTALRFGPDAASQAGVLTLRQPPHAPDL